MTRGDARSCGWAIAAAGLYALATPFSKILLHDLSPLVLAGLLYLGAGLGAGVIVLLRKERVEAPVRAGDLPWIAAMIAVGGVLAPLAILHGLRTITASAASLLSCLESVLTVLIAGALFREAVAPRVYVSAILVAAGGAVLAWQGSDDEGIFARGALLVALGSALWALDSNITRLLAHKDPIVLTALKCLPAGAGMLAIASLGGEPLPPWDALPAALLLGFVSYGASIVVFVRSLREIGAARTGALFGLSPFVAALLSLPLVGEVATARLGAAAVLMAAGSSLILWERHAHEHTHERLVHEHRHVHDEHHQHAHAADEGPEPHSHLHAHEPMVHSHPHAPDIHHIHEH